MRKFLWSTVLLLSVLGALPVRANLHDSTRSADYLIITPQSVIQSYPWIQQLADWRNAHGRTAMLVASDSIWAEFGNGSPSDSTLKDFLFYVFRHYRSPRLKDVFIIGWHDVVPSHVEPDSESTIDSLGHPINVPFTYLTDHFFTIDPDSANHLPVFSIGHLPWSPDSGALWDYYSKVTAYESTQGQDWQRRVHLIADRTDVSNGFYFRRDFAEPAIAAMQPGYSIIRSYADYPPSDPWHGDHDNILSRMNDGSYLSMYFGHGGASFWSFSLNITDQTFDSLTNGVRLPVIIGFCFDAGINGDFWLGPIAQAIFANSNGGGIGYLATANTLWAYAGRDYRLIEARLATSDSVETLGDVWRLTESEFIRVNGSDPWDPGTPIEETVRGAMLMGDPGVRLPARPEAISHSPALHPLSLSLSNAPNPFNPTTVIRFELPQTAHVKLEVMNILGERVETLLDEQRNAGMQSVTWNGGAHPSGVYFAVLQTGKVRLVKKMMLLK